MRIVHISSYVSDSSACYKLHRAMLKRGLDSHILTMGCSASTRENVSEIGYGGMFLKVARYCQTLFMKWSQNKNMCAWPFNPSMVGHNIINNPLIKQADLIHLHWICGMISIDQIGRLSHMGKPVIWTCHDVWAVTGGCNYLNNCSGCFSGNDITESCQFLKSAWLPKLIMRQKTKAWKAGGITFVAPSIWMKEEIIRRSAFSMFPCEVIPNTDDFSVFRRYSHDEIADIVGRLDGYITCLELYNQINVNGTINLLFGAVSPDTPYKGFSYLEEFLHRLKVSYPRIADKIVIHVIGNFDPKTGSSIIDSYKRIVWGYVSERCVLACIYSLMDVLIYPSWQDNLPSIVMEALACELPVLAFDTGGMRDMVEHKINGYVARFRDIDDFISGFHWIINNNNENDLGKNGRKKVLENFDQSIIVNKHKELYERCLRNSDSHR